MCSMVVLKELAVSAWLNFWWNVIPEDLSPIIPNYIT